MEQIKTDRRIRKTKTILRQELTKLLSEKELKNITVKELCDAADINRGTFYLHYKDIYDLFKQIEDDILTEFMSIIDKYRQRDTMIWISVLLDLLKYIVVNADIFRAILMTADSTLLTRILDISRPKNQKEWKKLLIDVDEKYNNYYYAFITEGCIAMVKSWFLGGMRETPEEMAALAGRLMSGCIQGAL